LLKKQDDNFEFSKIFPKSRGMPLLPLCSGPKFSISCARVRARTGCETSAHKKTWSTQYDPSKNVFAHNARHSKFRWVQVKCCTKEIICAHRLQKLEGTLLQMPMVVTWLICNMI